MLTSDQKDIIDAVSNSDIKKIKTLLEKDPKLITTYSPRFNRSLMHIAQTAEVAQILLDAGAQIDATSSKLDGWTPLIQEIEYRPKDIDLIKFLIKNGADINYQDLHFATSIIHVLSKIIYLHMTGKKGGFVDFSKPGSIRDYNQDASEIPYFIEILRLLTDNPKFDVTILNKSIQKYAHAQHEEYQRSCQFRDNYETFSNLWMAFIFYAILKPLNSKLLVKTYDTFKNESWFKELPTFSILSVIYNIINQKIDKQTARDFLKIDQKNPPKDFKDKNLEQIQKAYSFAKQYDLKKVGTYILNSMKNLVSLSGTFENTHYTLGGPEKTIASFTRIGGPEEKHVSLKNSQNK